MCPRPLDTTGPLRLTAAGEVQTPDGQPQLPEGTAPSLLSDTASVDSGQFEVLKYDSRARLDAMAFSRASSITF